MAADQALEADLRSMLGSALGVVMHVHGERDAISSGRDQTITIHNYADGAACLRDAAAGSSAKITSQPSTPRMSSQDGSTTSGTPEPPGNCSKACSPGHAGSSETTTPRH